MQHTSKELKKLIKASNKAQDFGELDVLLDSYLDQIKNANKICSFDMEFSDRTGDNIVEIGIAIHDKETNQTFTEHFIIEEQVGKYQRKNTPIEHSKMFAYGESKIVSLDNAMKALSNAFNNSDVNIIFAQDHKHKHMVNHNFSNDSFICIQDLMNVNCRDSRNLALTSAVEEFCDVEHPLNNAGNDAVATLEISSKVFGKRIELTSYNMEATKDFSEHPKMSSAATIRASRKANKLEVPVHTKESVAQTKNLKI